jgi:regulator of sirC expression with transglutaminase-like and TPR domain
MSAAASVSATDFERAGDDAVSVVRSVLNASDNELNYLEAKLAFDAVVEPGSDRAWVRAQVDRLAAAATALTKGDPRPAVRLGAVRTVLYDSGPWNDRRPFGFDMSDPDGRAVRGKLLENYLRTRLGQCVSMPVLFLILAERLGLKVALCAAPDHILVRYTDETGRCHNIEATSGGHPVRDEWIRQQLQISDRAMTSGIYLRTLTKREGIAMLAHTVVEHLREQGRTDKVVAVCELILEHDPREVNALLSLASAYGELLERWRRQHPRPFTARPEQVAHAQELMTRNAALFAAAEELGWDPLA